MKKFALITLTGLMSLNAFALDVCTISVSDPNLAKAVSTLNPNEIQKILGKECDARANCAEEINSRSSVHRPKDGFANCELAKAKLIKNMIENGYELKGDNTLVKP